MLAIQGQNLRRKRKFIPVTQFTGLQQKAFTPGGTLTMADGSTRFAYSPGGGDIKGATQVAGSDQTADKDADVVNSGSYIAAQTFGTVAGNAGDLGAIVLQPDVARTVNISIINDQGGGTPGDLYVGTTTFTITGTFRGQPQVDAVTLTILEAQKTVADAKFRWLTSAKPFDTITSITMDHAGDQTAALKVAVGPGSRVGLPVDPDSGLATDFTKLTVNAAAVVVSDSLFSYSVDNQTVDVGTIADGADVGIIYKVDRDGASGTFTGNAVAADTLLCSSGTGNALLKEINSLGIQGLLMAASNDIRHLMEVPWDLDRKHPVRVRVIWTSAEAGAAADSTATWLVKYLELTPNSTTLIDPATALDTAIAADLAIDGPYKFQSSPWGVINPNQIADAAAFIAWLVELDALGAGLAENVYLLGIQIEYSVNMGESKYTGHRGRSWLD